MSDLVGNPEDRFSRIAAHLVNYHFGSHNMAMLHMGFTD